MACRCRSPLWIGPRRTTSRSCSTCRGSAQRRRAGVHRRQRGLVHPPGRATIDGLLRAGGPPGHGQQGEGRSDDPDEVQADVGVRRRPGRTTTGSTARATLVSTRTQWTTRQVDSLIFQARAQAPDDRVRTQRRRVPVSTTSCSTSSATRRCRPEPRVTRPIFGTPAVHGGVVAATSMRTSTRSRRTRLARAA